MRRNPSTVAVLVGAATDEVLGAASRSMNVTLVRPEDGEEAAAVLRRAGHAAATYALVVADPLARVAASWQAMWDIARPEGPAEFEREAADVLTAWRAGQFELPDYYVVLATQEHGPGFHLGPLRSARPQRVAAVAEADPRQQGAAILRVLGSLRYGPWWPALDEVIAAARDFYPGSLAEQRAAEQPEGAMHEGHR